MEGNAQTPRLVVAHAPEPGAVDWYRPTWMETARLMGWRWIYFLPAVLILVYLFLSAWVLLLTPIFLMSKILIAAIVLPLRVFWKTARNIVQLRSEPFCIHCGYDLSNLPHNICPECGRPFSLATIDEYRRDPQWFVTRFNMNRTMPAQDVPFSAGAGGRRKSRDGTRG